jgi:hypothetical protein
MRRALPTNFPLRRLVKPVEKAEKRSFRKLCVTRSVAELASRSLLL